MNRALKNQQQRKAWGLEYHLGRQSISKRGSDFTASIAVIDENEPWTAPSAPAKMRQRPRITEDADLVAAANPALAINTKFFHPQENRRFLKAARATLAKAPGPTHLPAIKSLRLSGSVLDVFAHRGFDRPVRGQRDDGSIHRQYLEKVSGNSLAQALAYLKTLPDSYLVYGVTTIDEKGRAGGTNLHLLE